MLTFFQCWRRKIGAAMLALTCLLVVGWVRSQSHSDVYRTSQGRTYFVVASADRSLFFGQVRNAGEQRTFDFPVWDNLANTGWIARQVDLDFVWHFRSFGLSCGSEARGRDSLAVVMIPYWAIILPMFLLSASLLIGKSHPKRNQPDGTVNRSKQLDLRESTTPEVW